MADENTPPKPDLETDPSKINAEVAEKLKAQDISGQSLAPKTGVHQDTGDALDDILKQVQGKTEESDEAKAEAEAKAAEEKDAKEKAAAEANDPAKQAEKEAADKAAAEKQAAEKAKADELFKDTPSLPQGASPKSAEAFATVKIRAAQEISAREQKIAALEAEKKELEAKAAQAGKLPPEVETEVKALREWRAKLDIEADPKFKENEKTIANAAEFIYAQLRKHKQVDDGVINEIKKHGGPHKVKLDAVFAEIKDPTLQRIVESRIAEMVNLEYNQEQAKAAAKANVSEYMAARQKEIESTASQHNVDTENHLKQHLPKLEFIQQRQVPAGADEATKKAIEAHNKTVTEINQHIQEATKDDSPEMRAIMILGMGKLLYLQPRYESAKARITDLEKQLKEATDKIASFKNASVSRLRESAVPPGGKLPDAEKKATIHTRTGDALDEIMSQVQAENARK
jgi:hypothetical protein